MKYFIGEFLDIRVNLGTHNIFEVTQTEDLNNLRMFP